MSRWTMWSGSWIPVAQDGFELLDAMCGLEVPPPEQVQLREETEYFQYR